MLAIDDPRTEPRYTFAEADRLAKVGRGTSKRWLRGYTYWYTPDELRSSLPVNPQLEPLGNASFIDLMEVVMIGGLRRSGFSVPMIKKINSFCQVHLHLTRPLVTETFKVDGKEAFIIASQTELINVSTNAGMMAWNEVLDPFLESVDFEEQLIQRWWPRGRSEPVVLDSDYGFGLPVVYGTGVRTEIVAERYKAGDEEDMIAYDFSLEFEEVEAALRYEDVKRAS